MAFYFRVFLLCLAALGAGCSDSRHRPVLASGGDFVLQSATGPFDTRVQRGKVLVMFFGYTHCPDICPTNLGVGAQALKQLSPEERARVRLIFVSVDPERDTPKALAEYAAFFHPEMIGVTGTPAEIASVAKSYGAGYIRQPDRPDGGYFVDHTAYTYIIDPKGKLATVLDMNSPVDAVLKAVRSVL
jgi:protein SCO1/2